MVVSFSKAGISGASTISFNPETSKYTIKFGSETIETTVTDKAAIVDQWIQDIKVPHPPNSSVIIGLDVERSSSTSSIGRKKPATLHLCIDDKCLILQLIYIDSLPLSLKNFLKNPNYFFVGFEADSLINSVANVYGLGFGVHADVKEIAMEESPHPSSSKLALKDLAMAFFGLSNWENRVLSIEQVEYGTIDAYVSYK
ncbi:hypothetical protein PIB30_092503, partial [Stylosanthes scabra]|nr:hypothetical protein [Stylosanthes scabra]